MKRTPLKRVNKKRKTERFEANYTGPFPEIDHAAEVRKLSCYWCDKPDFTQAAHVSTRGAGADWSAIAPLCPTCHYTYDHYEIRDNQSARLRIHEEAYRLATETLNTALYYAEDDEQREHYQALFDSSWIAQWAQRREAE